MANSISGLENILNLNSRLFINALHGVTDQQAADRITQHNNPVQWLAAHTVWARFLLCQMLGSQVKNPYAGMFENFKPFDPAEKYPALDGIKTEWDNATKALKEALASVTDKHLAAEGPFPNPTGDITNAGLAAFLTQHESYDIGQMGFLKKYLTKEGMKY